MNTMFLCGVNAHTKKLSSRIMTFQTPNPKPLQKILKENYNSMNTVLFCGVNAHREKNFILFDETPNPKP
jgi:hypothetical protein